MKKILVGLSGGVDSAVTAYLLKEQGYDVTAGFMINYLTDDDSCPTRVDLEEARRVAEYLDIPFFTFDFVEEYERLIVDYIYDEYKKGLTPNPDVLCNSLVKFRLFLDEAIALGFDAVATGHYARITQDEYGYHLLKWMDDNKDQSYFLAGLSQDQLSKSLFPIGHLPKSEVREIAKKAGLPNAHRKDSQGLCFIGKINMTEFLKEKLGTKKGDIIDTNGVKVGEHDGAQFFTIGQRKGIGVWGGPAYYVVEKDVEQNKVIVGEKADFDLFSDTLSATEVHWIQKPDHFPTECHAKIRYRQEDQKVTISEKDTGDIQAVFDEKQRAVSPGQIIALYQWDELIGSAVIK